MESSRVLQLNSKYCSSTISPNGNFFATAELEHLRVYSSRDTTLVHQFQHPHLIDVFRWSPDSDFILCASLTFSSIYVFSMEHPGWRCTIEMGLAGLSTVLWTSDSRHIVAVSELKLQAQIFSTRDNVIRIVTCLKSAHPSLQLSPDGEHLALIETSQGDEAVMVMCTKTWGTQQRIRMPLNDIQGLTWNAQSDQIGAWEFPIGRGFMVFDLDGHKLAEYQFDSTINYAVWAGDLIYVACTDDSIVLVNGITWTILAKLQLVTTFQGRNACDIFAEVQAPPSAPSLQLRSMALSSASSTDELVVRTRIYYQRVCGKTVACMKSRDDLDPKELEALIKQRRCGVSHTQFSYDQMYLAARSYYNPTMVWIWNVEKLQLVAVLKHLSNITCLEWEPGRHRLLICTSMQPSPHAYVWTPNDASAIPLPKLGTESLNNIQWHPSGSVFLANSVKRTVVYSFVCEKVSSVSDSSESSQQEQSSTKGDTEFTSEAFTRLNLGVSSNSDTQSELSSVSRTVRKNHKSTGGRPTSYLGSRKETEPLSTASSCQSETTDSRSNTLKLKSSHSQLGARRGTYTIYNPTSQATSTTMHTDKSERSSKKTGTSQATSKTLRTDKSDRSTKQTGTSQVRSKSMSYQTQSQASCEMSGSRRMLRSNFLKHEIDLTFDLHVDFQRRPDSSSSDDSCPTESKAALSTTAQRSIVSKTTQSDLSSSHIESLSKTTGAIRKTSKPRDTKDKQSTASGASLTTYRPWTTDTSSRTDKSFMTSSLDSVQTASSGNNRSRGLSENISDSMWCESAGGTQSSASAQDLSSRASRTRGNLQELKVATLEKPVETLATENQQFTCGVLLRQPIRSASAGSMVKQAPTFNLPETPALENQQFTCGVLLRQPIRSTSAGSMGKQEPTFNLPETPALENQVTHGMSRQDIGMSAAEIQASHLQEHLMQGPVLTERPDVYAILGYPRPNLQQHRTAPHVPTLDLSFLDSPTGRNLQEPSVTTQAPQTGVTSVAPDNQYFSHCYTSDTLTESSLGSSSVPKQTGTTKARSSDTDYSSQSRL